MLPLTEPAHTPRLRIEALQPRHAPLLFPVLRDARLYTFVPERAHVSVDALADRFARLERGAPADRGETWLNWALLQRASPAPVGTLQATVSMTAPATAYIGYMIAPACWGQGLATEACRWLLGTLPAHFTIRTFCATVDVRNARSIGVLERLGFERMQTEAAELHGEPSLDYRYELRVVAAF